MKLPKPTDRLADCIWLPRLIEKSRLVTKGMLPEDYAERFCHPAGVDGHFLAYFDLSKDEVVAQSRGSDPEIAAWFLASPSRAARISGWNHLAVNLGRPGFPMAGRVEEALRTTFSHLVGERKFETVFELMEADEKDC